MAGMFLAGAKSFVGIGPARSRGRVRGRRLADRAARGARSARGQRRARPDSRFAACGRSAGTRLAAVLDRVLRRPLVAASSPPAPARARGPALGLHTARPAPATSAAASRRADRQRIDAPSPARRRRPRGGRQGRQRAAPRVAAAIEQLQRARAASRPAPPRCDLNPSKTAPCNLDSARPATGDNATSRHASPRSAGLVPETLGRSRASPRR